MRLVTVALERVGVGIADEVEPVASPLLAVVRRREQPVHHLFPGLWRIIGEEVAGFLLGRRQAGDAVGRPPQERLLVGEGWRGKPTPSEAVADEGVDRVGGRGGCRRLGPLDGPEGPVLAVLGALGDPAAECIDLRGREAGSLGRHLHIGIDGGDPGEDLAGRLVSRDDCPQAAVERGAGWFREVESEPGFAGVGPVAGEAPLGEERLDVAGEIDLVGRRGRRREHGDAHRRGHKRRQASTAEGLFSDHANPVGAHDNPDLPYPKRRL